MSTSVADEKKFALAREIAYTIDEPARQKVFAIVALFSGSEDDLKLANTGIANNKVAHIKVLLALGKEREALNIAAGFSSDGEEKQKSEASLAIVSFLLDKGRMDEAGERTLRIVDSDLKAVALNQIAIKQKEMIVKMADEMAELRRRLAEPSQH